MSLVVALLVAVGALLWPDHFGRCRVAILPSVSSTSTSASASASVSALLPALVARSGSGSGWGRGNRWRQARRGVGASSQDLLGLLDIIAPALDAGMAPASALRIAADSRSGSAGPDQLADLARELASAAADGATLGPLWRAAAESAGSPELLLLAQAWSLTEDMGAPLAHGVRTTAGLLEARVAHERRLAASVAGARATVNLLTVLPIAGPLLALLLGIGPGELFGGSRLTQASLVLGLCLACIGRWWVRRMVRAVARGPMIA